MTEVKKKNWIWSAIPIFLFFWFGDQLLKAIYTAEIAGFGITHSVSLEQEPFWFSVIVLIKLTVFIASTIYIYLHFIRKRLW